MIHHTVPLQNLIDDYIELTDMTTFSIIFAPSGKLIVQGLRVRNRDGRTENSETLNLSKDDIFNTLTKITDSINPFGMFPQDDYFGDSYPDHGLGPEPSRSKFIIYERSKFKEAYQKGQAYSGYLKELILNHPEAMIYINPYTGTIIEK